MDLTQGTLIEKNNRAKKMMLWFGIISLIMSFAGWTSAFIISSSRPDWLKDFQLPKAFIFSTVIIVLSSLFLILAKRMLRNNQTKTSLLFVVITFLLGLGFIGVQYLGFQQIINSGFYFTGEASNVTVSYIYLIAVVHILHVVVGLICLLVVIYNHYKEKYTSKNMLGFELATTFWHFIDILWIYLFLFLYFIR